MINCFASAMDVAIGMKYTALNEILFKTHMNDLVLGVVGMTTSGLRLYGDIQKNQEQQKEI